MKTLQENEKLEYTSLMSRGRDAESTSQICWMVCGVVSTVLLAWGISARSSALMLPVVISTAYGYYAMLRGRRQVRLIAGYIEEFFEGNGDGAHWFTGLGNLRQVPGVQPTGDWFATALSNLPVVLAVVLSWIFGGDPRRGGDMIPGLVTGLAVAFIFHSITETSRLHRANFATYWRQSTSSATPAPRNRIRGVTANR